MRKVLFTFILYIIISILVHEVVCKGGRGGSRYRSGGGGGSSGGSEGLVFKIIGACIAFISIIVFSIVMCRLLCWKKMCRQVNMGDQGVITWPTGVPQRCRNHPKYILNGRGNENNIAADTSNTPTCSTV